MDNKEAFSTLSDIRNMMEKSTRFLTLSGLSPIVIGIYACIAALIAHYMIGIPFSSADCGITAGQPDRLTTLILFAAGLIVLSIGTVVLMCRHKARQNNSRLHFDRLTRRLLWSLFMPLTVGGLLCLALISQQHYGLTSSIMLIFYGIALINISNHTYSNTRYLGYAELALGLADSFTEEYALLFWSIGFGIFHIVYGIFFYLKYDKTAKQQASSVTIEK